MVCIIYKLQTYGFTFVSLSASSTNIYLLEEATPWQKIMSHPLPLKKKVIYTFLNSSRKVNLDMPPQMKSWICIYCFRIKATSWIQMTLPI